jgi:hypothetical protein
MEPCNFFLICVNRMPTVTVLLASRSGIQLNIHPGDTFPKVLQESCRAAQDAISSSLPLQPIAVMYSSSNLPVPGWQEPQRAVGADDVTVMIQAAPLGDLMASLSHRMSAMEQSFKILAGPRISNAAAQILVHAAGEEFRQTSSNRYAAMGISNASIQQLSTLTDKKAGSIVSGADGVIERRNNVHVHFTSAPALKAEVQQCADLIATSPTMHQLYKWECWVIDNFAHFKVAFAPIFDY